MNLPTRDAVLDFIRQSPVSVGKREVARAFGLRGEDREALKLLLSDMEDEGLLEVGAGRSLHLAGGLPRVSVLKVVSAGASALTAVPDPWGGEGSPPQVRISLTPPRGSKPNKRPERYEMGDKLLARIFGEAPRYEGSIIKKLGRGQSTVLGIVRAGENRGEYFLRPVDKRERKTWPIRNMGEAKLGELVRVEIKGTGSRMCANVLERLGDPMSGRAISTVSIIAKNIPYEFPEGVEADAEEESAKPLGPREDWTSIPFLTIDPADARDHDDAVWAEPDGAGWRLLVAIADVSWYVRPGSPLDKSAFDRGNSVYFPDQVVPMLPEALSNGACSLKAGTDKAVLAADIRLSGDGELLSQTFHRARVRIATNLAYEAAQAMMNGEEGPEKPLLEPLWGCWKALMTARAKRSPLDLELPEKRVVLDAEGRVSGIVLRERLDAHRVIEEMMIAANVAAAKALESRKAPVMYRCHETPDRAKLTSLKEYLGSLGVSFALGQVITTETFNRILKKVEERDDYTEVAQAVLRSQTQAYYAPRAMGHFGLSLQSYAHFTSPIRRYADVLVHRSLVSTFGLGEGGLASGSEKRFAPIGEHISFTERRAMEAERETLDRYIARHWANHIGEVVRARISSVQAFGFFATVEDVGGDGLVPVSSLGDERFHFDEGGRFLEGNQSMVRYSQGQHLDLKIEESDPVTGSLRFSVPGVEEGTARGPRFRRDGRGKPSSHRGKIPPGIKRGRRS